MQAFGIVSFLSCIFSMYFIFIDLTTCANILFALAMLAFIISLVMSLLEIKLSTKALELELGDMEDLEDHSILKYLKKKFEREQ
jgi:hypothetical protein